MSKLNWDKLKDVRCPKCSTTLANRNEKYNCESSDCQFTIGEPRFNSLVDDLYD